MAELSLQDKKILETLSEATADDVLLFGSSGQRMAAEVSSAVAAYLKPDTAPDEELNELVSLITGKPAGTGQSGNAKGGLLSKLFGGKDSGEKGPDKAVPATREELLAKADRLAVDLQLQEARLIKTNTLLSGESVRIGKAIEELDAVITAGKEWLGKPGELTLGDDSGKLSFESDLKTRFERRLNDLRVSQTVACQTQAQIQLLIESNRSLVDKIIVAVTQTLPLWKMNLRQ